MIRLAEPKDASALTELMTELGYPASAKQMETRLGVILDDQNFATYVAIESGAVCGMIGLMLHPSYQHDDVTGRILALVVSQRIRGRGVGRRLVAVAEDYFRAKEVRRIVVTTRLDRTEAHRFYQGLGFTQTGLRFAKRIE